MPTSPSLIAGWSAGRRGVVPGGLLALGEKPAGLGSDPEPEELQFKDDEPTKVAIALYMVVAWRLLYVMKLGRKCPDLPCDVVFELDEWQAVWVVCHGEEAIEKKPSLGQFVITVARLGGFLARSADGHPGAQAMWQGLRRVQDFTLAWQVHTKKRGPLLGPAPAC